MVIDYECNFTIFGLKEPVIVKYNFALNLKTNVGR